MEIEIFGYVKSSLCDYYKKYADVIFLPYCNMDCIYCHNKTKYNNVFKLNLNDIINSNIKNIVITGGEPTIHGNLCDICIYLKEYDINIKLDTNGTNPDIVNELIDNDLIDAVSLDIKTTQNNYYKITKYNMLYDLLNKNLISDNIFKECRMTYSPDFINENMLYEICKKINNCDLFTIQQYIPIENTLNNDYTIPNETDLHKIKQIFEKKFKVRVLEFIS